MLKQRNRLKSRFYFKKTLDTGLKVVTPVAVVYGMFHQAEVEHRSATRFGFVVSKKVSKKAVVRNQVKRRLRHIVRQNILDNPDRDATMLFNVVLIARQNALEISYDRQVEMISQAFEKLVSQKNC